MRYYDLFSLMIYLSVLVGVGAVAVSERRLVYLVLTVAACAAAWHGDRARLAGGRRRPGERPGERPGGQPGERSGKRPGERPGEARSVDGSPPAGRAAWPVRALLSGGILAYALVDFLALGAGEFVSLAHLLQFTLVVKLTSRKGPRDYRQILLMALFNLVVAAYISVHVVFGVFLLAFVVSAGWALMLLVTGEQGGTWRRMPPDDYAPRRLDREAAARVDAAMPGRVRYLARTAHHAAAVLVPAVLVFLLVPRGGAGRVRLPSVQRYQSITGFTEQVQLGEIANILQNPDPVMRVELVDPVTRERITRPRVPLLWRGMTLDEYRKHRAWGWRKTVSDRVRYVPGRSLIKPGRVPRRDRILQHVYLEPIDSRVIFTLYPLISVEATENVGDMRIDRTDGSIQMVDPPAKLRRYDALSALYPVPRPRKPDERYLAVPEEIRGTLRRYARRIAPDGQYPTPAAKAGAMVRYFHSGRFAYTLTYRGTPGSEPVTDFLTRTRRGHCELFASAMALMLRTQGVATRLVNGFRGGEWSGLGRYLLVKQEDAHTWVEVYLPGQGWRAFDPTPGSPMARPMRGGSLAGYLGQAYDFLKWSWMQNVLRYDQRRQKRVFRVVGDAAALSRTALRWNLRVLSAAWSRWEGLIRRGVARMGVPDSSSGPVAVLVTAGVVVLLALPAAFLVRRLRRRRHEPDAPVAFYRALLRLLGRLGYRRAPAQTPLEFAREVADAAPETLGAVAWITAEYYRQRFGGRPPTPVARRRIREALAAIAALSRTSKGGKPRGG